MPRGTHRLPTPRTIDPWLAGGVCALLGVVLTPFLVASVGPMWSALAATGIAVAVAAVSWWAAHRLE